MPSANKALLQYEAVQTSYPVSALTDSGDHQTFTSQASIWSMRDGYAPEVRPNGLINGGAVTPSESGEDDKVDTANLLCYLAGVQTGVQADTDISITRASNTDTHRITSITVDSNGAIAAVAGTGGTSFSETRAANGGPPLIPVGSIEIAQVRVSSRTAAPITSAEIFAAPGTHQERYDYPPFDVLAEDGSIRFTAALPAIHTGPTARKVYASYADVTFVDARDVSGFTASEISNSATSAMTYDGPRGAAGAQSIGQAGFTALLKDGVSDPLAVLAVDTEVLWFKFYPDRNKSAHILTNGQLGMSRTFPADSLISATFAVTTTRASINRLE